MLQAQGSLAVNTNGQGCYEISRDIADWIGNIGADNGLLTVFIRHTSASLTIQENADLDVQRDLLTALDGLAPRDAPYRHRSEGSDDMPAHIKSALTAVNLSIPVSHGVMQLGTWQGVFVIEHRDRPRDRQIALHFSGEMKNGPDTGA